MPSKLLKQALAFDGPSGNDKSIRDLELAVLQDWKRSNDIIKINVGGTTYTFFVDCLLKKQHTRLGKLASAYVDGNESAQMALCTYYDTSADEYFFDRCAFGFTFVEEYHRYGTTYQANRLAKELVLTETDFWQLEKPSPKLQKQPSAEWPCNLAGNQSKCKRCRRAVWRTLSMKDPKTVLIGVVFNVITILLTLLALSVLITETLPEYDLVTCMDQLPGISQMDGDRLDLTKLTDSMMHLLQNGSSATADILELIKLKHPMFLLVYDKNIWTALPHCHAAYVQRVLHILELFCTSWFLLELFIRCWSARHPLSYLKSPHGIIQLGATIPVVVEQILTISVLCCGIQSFHKEHSLIIFSRVMRVFRVFRVTLLFRVASYFPSVRLLLVTLAVSFQQLLLFMVAILFISLFFATVVFEVESHGNHKEFYSIPISWWWSVVTVTTLGYGDMYPKTTLGKIVASVAIICSAICIAFPVSIITEIMRKEYDRITQNTNGDVDLMDNETNEEQSENEPSDQLWSNIILSNIITKLT